MKKIFLLFLIVVSCIFALSCDSGGGGDDLPPLSEAPYEQRLTVAIAAQAVADVIYEYITNGILPANVSESGDSLVFSNAHLDDVVLDYIHYQIDLTGTITAEENMTYDFSLVRRVSASGTYYCSFYAVSDNSKIKKIIINGTEYDPD